MLARWLRLDYRVRNKRGQICLLLSNWRGEAIKPEAESMLGTLELDPKPDPVDGTVSLISTLETPEDSRATKLSAADVLLLQKKS